MTHNGIDSMHVTAPTVCVALGVRTSLCRGRTWNSDFRGKLWIHAAAKEYPKEESEAIVKDHLERFRRAGYEPPPVPQTYPRSALIGRVEEIDIVTCEELQERVEKRDTNGE